MHPLVKSKRVLFIKGLKDNNLDIFEMTTNTNELAMELVNKKLLILKCYQVDVENIKCPLQWWEKMRTCLQLVFVLEKS